MKLSAGIIGHAILFIRSRHIEDVREAGKHQKWLKSKLKKNYSAVLLKHGDPDRGNYLKVIQAWCNEGGCK